MMLRKIAWAGMLGAAVMLAAPADAEEMAPAEREAIERVVRDYLLRHPEIILEAMEALQARQRTAQKEAEREALSRHADALFADPETPVMNPGGDVVLVEFFDYRCGVCRRVHPTVAELMRRDPDIRRVYKEWPILGPQSELAARAALAARYQDADSYFAFHDALMRANPNFDLGAVRALAERAGLDGAQLERDMARPEIARQLARNFALARALGLEGTPSYVIGRQVVRGGRDLETLQELVAEARQADPPR